LTRAVGDVSKNNICVAVVNNAVLAIYNPLVYTVVVWGLLEVTPLGAMTLAVG
jgi:hypothetical protein